MDIIHKPKRGRPKRSASEKRRLERNRKQLEENMLKSLGEANDKRSKRLKRLIKYVHSMCW